MTQDVKQQMMQRQKSSSPGLTAHEKNCKTPTESLLEKHQDPPNIPQAHPNTHIQLSQILTILMRSVWSLERRGKEASGPPGEASFTLENRKPLKAVTILQGPVTGFHDP